MDFNDMFNSVFSDMNSATMYDDEVRREQIDYADGVRLAQQIYRDTGEWWNPVDRKAFPMLWRGVEDGFSDLFDQEERRL